MVDQEESFLAPSILLKVDYETLPFSKYTLLKDPPSSLERECEEEVSEGESVPSGEDASVAPPVLRRCHRLQGRSGTVAEMAEQLTKKKNLEGLQKEPEMTMLQEGAAVP